MAINVAFKGAHHILAKVDAVSAPFGMLPRSPLFDQAIVEMAFTIPAGLKLRGSVEKYLLKQAVRDLLPIEILDRPKSGMLVPVEAWFRGPLNNFARERLLDGLHSWGLFRRDYLERLLARRLGGVHPRHGIKIWLLLTLEAWLGPCSADEPSGDDAPAPRHLPSWDAIATTAGFAERLLHAWLVPRCITMSPCLSATSCVSSTSTISPSSTTQNSSARIFCM